MPQHSPPLLSYLLIGGLIFVSIWLRARRLTRKRELRLQWMWIVPVLILGYGAFTLWEFPPHGITWLWLVLAAAMGGALGWFRGRLMSITYEADTRSLAVQGSPITVYLIGGLVALRFGLRAMMASQGTVPVMPLSQVNDILICFTVGLLTVQRAEMAWRAVRVKAAAGKPPPSP